MSKTVSLKVASERLGVHKNRLWRAIQDGYLKADLVPRGKRQVYRVKLAELERWKATFLDSAEIPVPQISKPTPVERPVTERPETVDAQEVVPLEVHLKLQQQNEKLVSQLRRSERMLVALQMQLQQEQRLLAETTATAVESQTRAKAALANRELYHHLSNELKLARQELTQWQEQRRQPFWKRLFGQSG